jgi:hypothetical protein
MRSKHLLGLLLLAFSTSVWANDLSVKVTPQKYAYSIEKNTRVKPKIYQDSIKLHFEVKPEIYSESFWVMSCGYAGNWESDNSMIYIPERTCDKDVPKQFDGKSKPFTGELVVDLTGISLGDKVKFHLNFTPYKDQDMKKRAEPSKSNEITISIVP